MSYPKIIAAICGELQRRYPEVDRHTGQDIGSVVSAMLECQGVLPDYLRLPMRVLTWGFDYWGLLTTGTRFRKLAVDQQARQFDAWKNSPFNICRNFARFYESLYLLIVLQEEAK